jgi:hypothetical protein
MNEDSLPSHSKSMSRQQLYSILSEVGKPCLDGGVPGLGIWAPGVRKRASDSPRTGHNKPDSMHACDTMQAGPNARMMAAAQRQIRQARKHAVSSFAARAVRPWCPLWSAC